MPSHCAASTYHCRDRLAGPVPPQPFPQTLLPCLKRFPPWCIAEASICLPSLAGWLLSTLTAAAMDSGRLDCGATTGVVPSGWCGPLESMSDCCACGWWSSANLGGDLQTVAPSICCP